MNKQPEALRWAAILEHQAKHDGATDYKHKAAAELRWLHEENERLRADAARIDWLERNGIGCDKVGNLGFFVYHNGTRYGGSTARAAIDAAIDVAVQEVAAEIGKQQEQPR